MNKETWIYWIKYLLDKSFSENIFTNDIDKNIIEIIENWEEDIYINFIKNKE